LTKAPFRRALEKAINELANDCWWLPTTTCAVSLEFAVEWLDVPNERELRQRKRMRLVTA